MMRSRPKKAFCRAFLCADGSVSCHAGLLGVVCGEATAGDPRAHSKPAAGVGGLDPEEGPSGSFDHLHQRRWGGVGVLDSEQGGGGCCMGPDWEGEGCQGTAPLG